MKDVTYFRNIRHLNDKGVMCLQKNDFKKHRIFFIDDI